MRIILAIISIISISAVSAGIHDGNITGALIFKSDLLKHGHARIAALHHISYIHGEKDIAKGGSIGASASKIRFILLIPAINKIGELIKEGFASEAIGMGHKKHEFLKFDDNELIIDIAAISDCKTWHGIFITIFNSINGAIEHKVFAGIHEGGHWKIDFKIHNIEGLIDFIYFHADKLDLAELLKKGIASHIFTHKLHAHLHKHGLFSPALPGN